MSFFPFQNTALNVVGKRELVREGNARVYWRIAGFLGKLLMFVCVIFGNIRVQTNASGAPLDLRLVGAELGYPAGAMEIEDITSDHQFVHGSNIIRAFRINGKAPSTFFPIIIAIANEGTLLNEECKRILATFDSASSKPFPDGRGLFGGFSLPNNVTGGLYAGDYPTRQKIKHLNGDFPMTLYNFALLSVVTIPASHCDCMIAILAPFRDGRELIKVPGGEKYHDLFAVEGAAMMQSAAESAKSGLKKIFLGLNRQVIASPLVTGAAPPARESDQDAPGEVSSPDAAPSPPTPPESRLSKARDWPAILAVLLFGAGAVFLWLRRRKV